jgi:two-component system secretion system response regulator SalR
MNILLIDDHMLIGKSLEITLKKEPSVSEFHYISDPKLTEYTINLFKPSIVLLDIHMGEHNGLEIGKHIIQKFNIKLVFLSGFDLIEYREKAIEIGASGFLNKNIPINCLITTLKKILYDDETFFPSNSDHKLYSSLTNREKEILQYLSSGDKQSIIATKLNISDRTIRNHIASINEKLDTHSTLASVLKAIELGIIRTNLQ